MAKPYVPIDTERCQRLRREGAFTTASEFMKLGPPRELQCAHRPVWIALELEPSNPDGAEFRDERGAMSLCDECRDLCAQRFPSGVRYAKLGPAFDEKMSG